MNRTYWVWPRDLHDSPYLGTIPVWADLHENEDDMNKIKKYDACIIKTNGTITEAKPKNGKDFQLDELKEAIGGGYIEVVRTTDDSMIMVLDEEGKLKRMPVNPVATALYPNLADIIVGDVLVCKRAMVK